MTGMLRPHAECNSPCAQLIDQRATWTDDQHTAAVTACGLRRWLGGSHGVPAWLTGTAENMLDRAPGLRIPGEFYGIGGVIFVSLATRRGDLD